MVWICFVIKLVGEGQGAIKRHQGRREGRVPPFLLKGKEKKKRKKKGKSSSYIAKHVHHVACEHLFVDWTFVQKTS